MYTASEKIAHRIKKKIKISKTGCWNWCGFLNNSGYGRVSEGKSGYHLTHRAMYAFWNKPVKNGFFVLHKCDNTKFCNPEHLFLGTAADNSKDRDEKQRTATKLTLIEVNEIKVRYKYGDKQTHLAKIFNVSQAQISRIVNQKQRNP
jgi:hypothetical protein